MTEDSAICSIGTKLIILPEQEAVSLKCSKCTYYLNVPPIKTSLDGKVHQCGRCDFDDPVIIVRNFAYEKIGKYMVFPCIFNDCAVKVTWPKVQQHEIECLHRTIPCPVMDCEEIILCTKIIEHFNELHRSSIISDLAVRFHKLTPCVDLGLLIHEGTPYFCMYSSLANVFKVSVFSVRNKSADRYTLDLYTLTFQKRKISVSGEKINLFDDRRHCIRCFSGTCKSLYHSKCPSKGLVFQVGTEIDIASIRSILKSETVCSKVSIQISKTIEESIENCDIVRKLAECIICKEYMSPPIHFCQRGHITCNKCQKKMLKCPICFGLFIEARNFAIEELCSNIIIPCHNKSCDFVGDLKELHIHEDDCVIKDVKVITASKEVWKFG